MPPPSPWGGPKGGPSGWRVVAVGGWYQVAVVVAQNSWMVTTFVAQLERSWSTFNIFVGHFLPRFIYFTCCGVANQPVAKHQTEGRSSKTAYGERYKTWIDNQLVRMSSDRISTPQTNRYSSFCRENSVVLESNFPGC